MSTQILGLVLTAAALFVIGYLVSLVWGSLHLRILLGRILLRRRVAQARAGDRFLDAGAVEEAVLRYRRSFYPYPARSVEFAEAVRRHHTGLLSRLLAAADQVPHGGTLRLMSLARADRLFRQRELLQRQHLNARRMRRGVRDAERKLRVNARDLRAALASLAEEIAAARMARRIH